LVLVLVTSVDSELSLEPVVKLPGADLGDARREDFARMVDASDSLQPKMAILRKDLRCGATPSRTCGPWTRLVGLLEKVDIGAVECYRREWLLT
jgi:hypothetical protein